MLTSALAFSIYPWRAVVVFLLLGGGPCRSDGPIRSHECGPLALFIKAMFNSGLDSNLYPSSPPRHAHDRGEGRSSTLLDKGKCGRYKYSSDFMFQLFIKAVLPWLFLLKRQCSYKKQHYILRNTFSLFMNNNGNKQGLYVILRK